MGSSTTPLRQRLVFRITYLGILPAVLILGLVAGFGVYKNYTDSVDMTRNTLRQVAEQIAAELDVQNRMACVLVSTMATQKAARWNPTIGDRERTLQEMKALLPENPWCIGVYFDYEVNADGLDAHYAANPMEGCQAANSGQFVPYAFLDWKHGNALSVKATVDLETSLYFAGIREVWRSTQTTLPLITEPYIYDGQAMIETVAPLVVDGKFVGIAGCDRALRDIAREVRSVCEANGVDAFVISSGSKVKGFERPRAFITASTDAKDVAEDAVEGMLRTKAVDDTAYGPLTRPRRCPAFGRARRFASQTGTDGMSLSASFGAMRSHRPMSAWSSRALQPPLECVCWPRCSLSPHGQSEFEWVRQRRQPSEWRAAICRSERHQCRAAMKERISSLRLVRCIRVWKRSSQRSSRQPSTSILRPRN
jgi:hypothetical protein